MRAPLLSSRGKCRDCLRTRLVCSCRRSGGGSYRRSNRSYRSSICGSCAIDLLRHAGGHASVSRWDVQTLDHIVASLGSEEAAEVLTAFRERRDRARRRE